MRVLILATDIYTRGGIARCTYTLASAWADLIGPENVDVLALLAYGDPSDVRPRFRVLGPVSVRLTTAAKVQFAMKALALARNKYDLIVCSILSLAPVAAAIRFIYKTPYWVVCHGTEVWGPVPPHKRLALQQSDRLLPISRFTAERLSKVHQISPAKVSIIHNAIPHDFERLLPTQIPVGEPRKTPSNQERVILSVGSLTRFHAYKGFDTVIRALPWVRERVPNLRYVIVGEGDDQPRLEKLVSELRLGRIVVFAGSLSDEQLAKCYHTCDVFVLPSKTMERNGSWVGEGFGRVYVEAALAGKPVVGSLGGGAAEAVVHGKTGFLVDPASCEDTARAIIKLFENPIAASQMGAEGRKWARQYFTEDALRISLGRLIHACKLGEGVEVHC